MLKLKAYNLKEIQNFISLLVQFDQQNIKKVSDCKKHLQNYVNNEIKKGSKYVVFQSEKRSCPGCKTGVMLPVGNFEKLNIWGCTKCRYSEIREVTNVK